MRFAVVSYHVPEPQGSAAGRALLALGQGLLSEGHDVSVWSWRPERPTQELPPWCTWDPLPAERMLRTRLRAMARPRSDVTRARWSPPEGALCMADEFLSFPAVAAAERSVLTVHYLTALDVKAVGGWGPRTIQDARGEGRALRHAGLVISYSPRVAGSLLRRASTVPIALPLSEPIAVADQPVAALMADWRWPPNRWALDRLLMLWDDVRRAVPSARLLLAGRGLERRRSAGGIEWLGEVAQSADVLARAAVLAFPCPPTSGPKVKVLEALAHGLPVVTTPAGVEGVAPPCREGTAAVGLGEFAATLAAVLRDPERRSAMAAAGRTGFLATHAPAPAARARVAACVAWMADDRQRLTR